MIGTIVRALKRSVGLGQPALPDDVDIDRFVERLQELLMAAPYSREVRELGRFARQHANPEFKQVYERKRALLDQYQRENRRPGLASWLMYVAERYVPGTSQPSLLRDVTLTLAMVCLVVFGIEYAKAPRTDESHAAPQALDYASHTIRIESSATDSQEEVDSSTFDLWLTGKVESAMANANFGGLIASKLEEGLRENETDKQLQAKLCEALQKTNLEELIGKQIRDSLQDDSLDQKLKDSLAEILADSALEQRASQVIQDSLTSEAFTRQLASALEAAIQTDPAVPGEPSVHPEPAVQAEPAVQIEPVTDPVANLGGP